MYRGKVRELINRVPDGLIRDALKEIANSALDATEVSQFIASQTWSFSNASGDGEPVEGNLSLIPGLAESSDPVERAFGVLDNVIPDLGG